MGSNLPVPGRRGKVWNLRVSSVAMGPAEGLLSEPTADTRARWVPGSGLGAMGAPQHEDPEAGLSIRGLALTELAVTGWASYSNSYRREARRNPANA